MIYVLILVGIFAAVILFDWVHILIGLLAILFLRGAWNAWCLCVALLDRILNRH